MNRGWHRLPRFLGMGILLTICLLFVWLLFTATSQAAQDTGAPPVGWQHLSTATGDLEPPTASAQQVLSLVLDVDNDGDNDFVIGVRRAPGPSLVWYRRDAAGWTRFVIEREALQLEAGGAFYDIDGDGDLDVVAGNNNQGNQIWWWENPSPDYQAGTGWTRHFIKNSGANKHHDMMFGNFDDDPRTEFVFWNQGAARLFIVDVPDNPRATQPWPNPVAVWSAPSEKYEGLAQADVNGDGKSDIIGGGRWFEHAGGTNFTPRLIEDAVYSRVAAGQIIPGGRPEIVEVPGDGNGPARWFEWNGSAWVGRDLPVGVVKQGHSLALGDVDQDGQLDVFLAEMRRVTSNGPDNADARLILLFGDGAGNFRPGTIATGFGTHEARLADLDGDGDLDILGKPFIWDTPRLDIWLNQLDPGGDVGCTLPGQWTTHVIDDARPRRALFVDAADLDGDGLKDVVAGAWWYRNPGPEGGAWPRAAIGEPLNQMALVADLEGDGDVDILGTVHNGPQEQHGNAFVWAQNDGAGHFTMRDNIPAGGGDFLQGVALGAFGQPRQIALSWHNQKGGIQALTIPDDPVNQRWSIGALWPQSAGEQLSAGDVDGDGDADLLLGETWLENAPAWAAHPVTDSPLAADRNRLADMDRDGDLDAVVGYEGISETRPVAWYEQPDDPARPWAEHVIGRVVGPQSLDVGDLDGDGDLDVVVGEHNVANPGAGRVLVFENRGGTWTEHRIDTGHEHHDGTQLVDIENDGDLDILSIGWTHDDVLLYERVNCAPAGPTPEPTAEPTATPDSTPTPVALPTATPLPGAPVYYLSSTTEGTVGGVAFADEDLLSFDTATGQWALFLDGSDIGLEAGDVDAADLLPDGSILLSLDNPLALPGLETVDDSDILRFVPTTGGADTTGALSLYFDGSDVDLARDSEDVSAVAHTADGGLLISLTGGNRVPGIPAHRDEDILLFQPAQLGDATAGSWSPFFIGAKVGLREQGESVAAADFDPATGQLTLAGPAGTQMGDLTGAAADLLLCQLAGMGDATDCDPPPTFLWRGGDFGFGGEDIDALAIGW